MKNLFAAALISSMAVSAQAGSIAYVAPESSIVDIEPNMGIGGSWILPAVIVSVLALAILMQPEEVETPQ